MKTAFLITGLLLLLIANLLMVYSQGTTTSEGFAGYFLENAGPSGLGKLKITNLSLNAVTHHMHLILAVYALHPSKETSLICVEVIVR